MEGVGNHAEVSKGAVVVYWRAAGGESLFANLKLSLMATQPVFSSFGGLHVALLGRGKHREYMCLRKIEFAKLPY